MKKQLIFLLLIAASFMGCEKLEQLPEATTSRDAVFSSEKGLELYANSFYQILPNANNIHTADDMSDYAARRDAPNFLRHGAYSPSISDNTSASAYDLVALGPDWNWEWGSLRNLNYFMANNIDERVPAEARKHYTGVARFFRAFFYFEKVKRYGDVPWINKPFDVNDPDLYKPRDSRTLVMDSILADLDYACQNIRSSGDASRTLITKWTALRLRQEYVCLKERSESIIPT